MHAAPATLSLASFVTPLLECEVSFLLGANLPARAGRYTREEIEAAIEVVVPAMEIADCRWSPGAPDLLKLADSMGNGAFTNGQPVKDWRTLDLSGVAVTLLRDGSETERCSSARILGNPLLAAIALANAQPLPAGGRPDRDDRHLHDPDPAAARPIRRRFRCARNAAIGYRPIVLVAL